MGTASNSTCLSSPTLSSAQRPRCESARLMERFVAFPSRPSIALSPPPRHKPWNVRYVREMRVRIACVGELGFALPHNISPVDRLIRYTNTFGYVCVVCVEWLGSHCRTAYHLSPAAPPAPGHSLLVTRGSARPSYMKTCGVVISHMFGYCTGQRCVRVSERVRASECA